MPRIPAVSKPGLLTRVAYRTARRFNGGLGLVSQGFASETCALPV